MDSIERNCELYRAVRLADKEGVERILRKGETIRTAHEGFFPSPMTENHVEIVKLLLRHAAIKKEKTMFPVYSIRFRMQDKTIKTVKIIFEELMNSECKGPLELDVLKLLIDHGLPVNDYYRDFSREYISTLATPLFLSIKKKRADFVSK